MITSQPEAAQTQPQTKGINDKYFSITGAFHAGTAQVAVMLKSHVSFFTNQSFVSAGVKGSLKNHIEFWKSTVKASTFVVDTLEKGYVIPFMSEPPSMLYRNNKSALSHSSFVESTISELLSSGCIVNVPFQPYIVSPLSVAENSSGKLRLILDLSNLNFYVRKDKVKFEDWKIAAQYFQKDSYLYKFDLKSGYFHIDICPSHMTYLGFSWNSKFYCYTVLPFGLSSAPYIFTKCLRPMVKFWRQNSIKIVLYLDDGLGVSESERSCTTDIEFVTHSLANAGFILNNEKSILYPTQCLEWLGIMWDSPNFVLSIPDRRVQDSLAVLRQVRGCIPRVTARLLAKCTGKVISLSPVIGNVCRLMTRHCYKAIESRLSWDGPLVCENIECVLNELDFWITYISKLNVKHMHRYSSSDVLICSDASSVAAGAVCIEHDKKVFHQMFSDSEIQTSSTFREMLAIDRALLAFEPFLGGKTVKLLTDNQNCVRIIESGSTKPDLHNLSFSIFTFCLRNNISLETQWIPRSQNDQADFISKFVDYDDWSVSNDFFDFVNSLWGPHTIDRFASYLNTKLSRFNSYFWNPGSEAVDAFSQNWCNDNNWLVPPVRLVNRVIRHVLYCKAKATLIVPYWASAPFWPLLFDRNMCYRQGIVDAIVFSEPERIFVRGSARNCIFGTENFHGQVLAIRFDASVR